MRIALERLGCRCVFSSEWDSHCQKTYEANFGERPAGDITKIQSKNIPNHEILLAGFPCQAFSIMGDMKGFQDTRGTLFFEVERILKAKRPVSFILENVKQLVGHDRGRTFRAILDHLESIGYYTNWKVLNALDFGLPHKRERIFIVGFLKPYAFQFPSGGIRKIELDEILQKDVDKKYYVSKTIRDKRWSMHKPSCIPSIWHENKAGHISSYPHACALRATASYNYLLVNGERRLTPREMMRLLGFPDSFKVVCSYSQVKKQAGNSLAVPVVEVVGREVLKCLRGEVSLAPDAYARQGLLFPELEQHQERKAMELAIAAR